MQISLGKKRLLNLVSPHCSIEYDPRKGSFVMTPVGGKSESFTLPGEYEVGRVGAVSMKAEKGAMAVMLHMEEMNVLCVSLEGDTPEAKDYESLGSVDVLYAALSGEVDTKKYKAFIEDLSPRMLILETSALSEKVVQELSVQNPERTTSIKKERSQLSSDALEVVVLSDEG